MLVVFLVAIILYLVALYIFSHIKGYSSQDYEIKEVGTGYYRRNIDVLKEDAVPKRFKLKLWIILVGVFCFLIPILNIVAGVIFIICSFIPLDTRTYKFYPGKYLGKVINFFSTIFTKEL